MNKKIEYIEPITVVAPVNTEGFMTSSITLMKFEMKVDEYETFDEVTLDVLE